MIAQKSKIIICTECRKRVYVIRGQEEPEECPHCGAEL